MKMETVYEWGEEKLLLNIMPRKPGIARPSEEMVLMGVTKRQLTRKERCLSWEYRRVSLGE